jgi:hypothetical protein
MVTRRATLKVLKKTAPARGAADKMAAEAKKAAKTKKVAEATKVCGRIGGTAAGALGF